MTQAIIYACSHRRKGNSDRVADLLAQGVKQAGGTAQIMHIRDYDVRPCIACGFCDKSPHLQGHKRCALSVKDQSWELFSPIFEARTVLFASPIYFYHLPSMFKTWIDRGQQFWKARIDGEPWVAELPRRTARAVLVAGQPMGEKLFEGSRLTLKYFVQNFNMELAEPLTFRGVDKPGDLAAKTEFERQIIELGTLAWNEPA